MSNVAPSRADFASVTAESTGGIIDVRSEAKARSKRKGSDSSNTVRPRKKTRTDRVPIYCIRYWNKKLERHHVMQCFGSFRKIMRCDLGRQKKYGGSFLAFIEFDTVPENESELLNLKSVDVNGTRIARCSVARGTPKKTKPQRKFAQEQAKKSQEKKEKDVARFNNNSSGNRGSVGLRAAESERDPDVFDGTLDSFDGQTPLEHPPRQRRKTKRKKRGKQGPSQRRPPKSQQKEVNQVQVMSEFGGEEVFGRLFFDQSLHIIFAFLDFQTQLRFGEVCRFCYSVQGDLMSSLRQVVLRGSRGQPLRKNLMEMFIEKSPWLRSLTLGGHQRLCSTYSVLICRLPVLTSLRIEVNKAEVGAIYYSKTMRCVTPHGLKLIAQQCPLLEDVYLGGFVQDGSLQVFLDTARNLKSLTVFVKNVCRLKLQSPALKLKVIVIRISPFFHVRDVSRSIWQNPLFIHMAVFFPNLEKLIVEVPERLRRKSYTWQQLVYFIQVVRVFFQRHIVNIRALRNEPAGDEQND